MRGGIIIHGFRLQMSLVHVHVEFKIYFQFYFQSFHKLLLLQTCEKFEVCIKLILDSTWPHAFTGTCECDQLRSEYRKIMQ